METASIRKSERAHLDQSLFESLNLKKPNVNDLKSTEPSLLKYKSNATLDINSPS